MNQPCQTGPAQTTSLYFFLSLAGDTHGGVGLLGQHSNVLWMNNNWTLQLLLDSANQCIAKLWKNCSAFPLTPSLHFFPDIEQGYLSSSFAQMCTARPAALPIPFLSQHHALLPSPGQVNTHNPSQAITVTQCLQGLNLHLKAMVIFPKGQSWSSPFTE